MRPMLFSIDFDDQAGAKATEVSNVGTKRNLPAEM